MTPFPETEIMTIKRIEVALRKMDLKLLKDGAYKLHEKFHSGYKFEYCDVLSEILAEINASAEIPEDIKGILVPTIEDILNSKGTSKDSLPSENLHVSSLTSLSYKAQNENNNNTGTITLPKESASKLSAFSAFGSKEVTSPNSHSPILTQMGHLQGQNINEQNTQTQPFQEFREQNEQQMQENLNTNELNTEQNQQALEFEPQQEQKEVYNQNFNEENKENYPAAQIDTNTQSGIENNEEIITKTKTVAIFYNQNNSKDKIKNIKRYRELLKKDETEINLYEIISLIKEITTQSNTNVSELKSILEQLNAKEHIVNLITNSSSANLVQLLDLNGIKYSLVNPNNDVKLNLLPLLGLSNLFKCHNCGDEILNNSSALTSMILECPKCKSPMLPSFYAISDNVCELDMDCYNQSMIALANSEIWLIISPSLEDKVSQNLLKSALKMSNAAEKIFIIDKDINVRETYKNMFLSINENVEINAQVSVIEDFLNVID